MTHDLKNVIVIKHVNIVCVQFYISNFIRLMVKKLSSLNDVLLKNESMKKCFDCVLLILILLPIGSRADPLAGAQRPCLTGTFTDIQYWLYDNGTLHEDLDYSKSLDLSDNPMAVDHLRQLMNFHEEMNRENPDENVNGDTNFKTISNISMDLLQSVVYLSLARNKLYRIPLFYSSTSGTTKLHFKKLRYLSFYGNDFGYYPDENYGSGANYEISINATNVNEIVEDPNQTKDKHNWASDLQQVYMEELLELDLRACGIKILTDDTFIQLTSLRRLYLSHNNIQTICGNAFNKLSNLIHLDLSINGYATSKRKMPFDSMSLDKGVFIPLKKLKSLDLSFSKISSTSGSKFSEIGSALIRLSLCYTKFPSITLGLFNKTSLKYMDITGNIALEALGDGALQGIEDDLLLLNANRLGIKSTHWIANLTNVRILSLSDNDITKLEAKDFEKLTKLQILNLMNNRISNWYYPVFEQFKSISMLKLSGNSLNLMTKPMIKDLNKVKFLGIGNNKFVCNCDLQEFVHRGIRNMQKLDYKEDIFIEIDLANDTLFDYENSSYVEISEHVFYLESFKYYRSIVQDRVNISFIKHDYRSDNDYQRKNCSTIFLDFLDQPSICLDPRTSEVSMYDNITCEYLSDLEESVMKSTALYVSLVSVGFIILIMAVLYWKRWYVRYFFMMVKNAAILSVMGNANGNDVEFSEEEKVFTYDVFVSYCDEDRKWVLNHLLPEVERNTPISICLHERDFQVGLSILENIISSMDRSRILMMIVSNQFLLSQWCQFEMHLAQHRLLETRREQLILVLLENIPRSRRPNTLHYLMMTKTYIVWPKDKPSEQREFWKRLKKALMHGKSIDKSSSI